MQNPYNIEKSGSSRKLIAVVIISIAVMAAGILAVYFYSIHYLNSASAAAQKAAVKAGSGKSQTVDLGKALRKRTVDQVCDDAEIPAYTYAEVCDMDMSKPSGVTVEDLKLVTKLGLVGLEDKLYQMEQDYDLNCLFLLAIASHESAYGTSMFHPNNICGYGYSGFSSKEECLDTVGRVLAKNYLDPSGPYYKGNTIQAVNRTYAADSSWYTKVAKKVAYFYQVISPAHNAQVEAIRGED